jgi:hypothetical protein
MGWVPLTVEIRRNDDPLGYELIEDDVWPVGTKECAATLDELDVPLSDGVRRAAQVLRDAGRQARQDVIRAAVKYRKRRSDSFHFVGDKRSPGRDDGSGNASGNAPVVHRAVTDSETLDDTPPDQRVTPPVTLGNSDLAPMGNTVPPLRGHSYPERAKPDLFEEF